MKISIIKKGWLRQKYHARIVDTNTQTTWVSENHTNLKDLEEMIAHTKKELSKAIVVYEFDAPKSED